MMMNRFCYAVVLMLAADIPLPKCRERAVQGDAEALWQMGQRYEKGDGVRKDNLKAVAQYRKAAEKNHPEACGRLAELYDTGRIVGKDPVKAARYRAIAKGESGELAAAKAQTEQEKTKIDYIEIALDHLIGRNGQTRDAKKGIQLLYNTAKDNPTAQRVFVRRWEKGDLDDGLNMLSDEEWKLVIPWFKNEWDKGFKAAGQLLGNDEYRKARAGKTGEKETKAHYAQAVRYWCKSNRAKCWYFVGQFYNPLVDGNDGEISGPEEMKDETKAIKSYENCIRIDSKYEDARWRLGFLYQAAKRKENIKPTKALEQFQYLLKLKPDDADYNCMYGMTGYYLVEDEFALRYGERVKWLLEQIKCNQAYVSSYEGMIVSGTRGELLASAYRNLQSQKKEYDSIMNQKAISQEPYLNHIRKAARMGDKDAQKFLEKLSSS